MKKDDRLVPETTEALLAEVERLTWALLDDCAEDADSKRLSALLEEHEAARLRYLECVQLHVDLRDRFAARGSAPQTGGKPVVLPNLSPGGLSRDAIPHTAD